MGGADGAGSSGCTGGGEGCGSMGCTGGAEGTGCEGTSCGGAGLAGAFCACPAEPRMLIALITVTRRSPRIFGGLIILYFGLDLVCSRRFGAASFSSKIMGAVQKFPWGVSLPPPRLFPARASNVLAARNRTGRNGNQANKFYSPMVGQASPRAAGKYGRRRPAKLNYFRPAVSSATAPWTRPTARSLPASGADGQSPRPSSCRPPASSWPPGRNKRRTGCRRRSG